MLLLSQVIRPTKCDKLSDIGHATAATAPTASYVLWRMKSATRSAIIMVVALVLARITSGITDASATRSPSSPYTRQYWSTTARGSEAAPILQVPEICCVVLTLRRNQ